MNQQDCFIQNQIPSMIILFVLLCLASVGGVLIFFDNFFEYLGLILPVFLGIMGGFYASLKSVEATQESIKTAKIEKALEYINKWDSTELQTPRRETSDFVHQINNGNNDISGLITKKPQIEFDMRIICNFWEKIYILLRNNLADKSILLEAFRDLYQQKYHRVCTNFLGYLSSTKSEANTAMSEHLNNLMNNGTGQ
ncbi:MAG: hypothetical protein ACK552_00110 [Microcystis sp.]